MILELPLPSERFTFMGHAVRAFQGRLFPELPPSGARLPLIPSPLIPSRSNARQGR